MKIIINASNIKATGATQVTVSFIRECINIKGHSYYLFLSKTVAEELNLFDFPDNFDIHLFDHKPFFNPKGLLSWNRCLNLEKRIKPDCVFSVFGPSIWKPQRPHLMGYAYAYYIYPESPFFDIISLNRKIKISVLKKFHGYDYKHNGDAFVCETEDVSSRLPGYIKCNPEKVYTVTNTYNDFYKNYIPKIEIRLPAKSQNEFRFVSLSTFTTHKNLSILNDVIPILNIQLKNINVKFVLTVSEKTLKEKFSAEAQKKIINLGRIKVEECPQVYDECDAMFLPTLMECFSASYAEAMKMGKPILTSDLSFARSVCQDAAIYFQPLNPEDITAKIVQLVENVEVQKKLVINGFKRLDSFDTPQSRAGKYLDICEMISKSVD